MTPWEIHCPVLSAPSFVVLKGHGAFLLRNARLESVPKKSAEHQKTIPVAGSCTLYGYTPRSLYETAGKGVPKP